MGNKSDIREKPFFKPLVTANFRNMKVKKQFV